MKLSEAIRLGSLMTERCSGEFIDHNGRTCALGAAMDAVGKLPACGTITWEFESVMYNTFPLLKKQAKCPECGLLNSLRCLIPHLNNDGWSYHSWPREQIAEWVATIEAREEAKTEQMSSEPEPHPTQQEEVIVNG